MSQRPKAKRVHEASRSNPQSEATMAARCILAGMALVLLLGLGSVVFGIAALALG